MITTTTAGKIEGRELTERGPAVLQFRGVPFAASTGGANRFRPAQPVEPWEGVRNATKRGPAAPQPPSALEGALGGQQGAQGEDCLSLNITTPGLDGARPVLVWINGGAVDGWSGSVPWYDGESFARNGDVVVVSINYRLGALGFLHVGHLLGEAYADSGSAGIADQITALEWVRDNIAAFGGDPNNVTIFGESAGGMSVGCNLAAPRARGLFGTAIAQSGAAHNASTSDAAADITSQLLGELGLKESDADALLSIDVDALMAAQAALSLRGAAGGGMGAGMPFMPMAGTPTLPVAPIDAIRDGSAKDIRVVTGTTTEEFKLFTALLRASSGELDEASLRKRITSAVGDSAADLIDAYTASRPEQSPGDIFDAIVTDYVFRIPAIRMLEAQSAHRDDVFLYEFGHRSTAFGGALGACHAIEIPFVFDNVHKRGVEGLLGEIGDNERALSTQVNAAWIATAKGDEPWARYDTTTRTTMRFGSDTPGLLNDPAGNERELWDGLR
jgi:para-nitrobenzyl esterase